MSWIIESVFSFSLKVMYLELNSLTVYPPLLSDFPWVPSWIFLEPMEWHMGNSSLNKTKVYNIVLPFHSLLTGSFSLLYIILWSRHLLIYCSWDLKSSSLTPEPALTNIPGRGQISPSCVCVQILTLDFLSHICFKPCRNLQNWAY